MTKKKNKKLTIFKYFKHYKFQIFLYILLIAFGAVADIFKVIFFAKAIEFLTNIDTIKLSLIYMLIGVGITVGQRVCWWMGNLIYNKYANKIVSEINTDLAAQSFKLDSTTYSDHDTGTFVQRIVYDPVAIIDNMSQLVDSFLTLISSIVMLIYISTLNYLIALCLLVIIVLAILIEIYRLKIRKKNKFIDRKNNDKINSLTTEIVRSEKDIKSLGLESKLKEISKENYQKYRKHRARMDIVDFNFWSIRNIIIDVGNSLTLILGIFLMDKGIITLATFLIVYANRGSLWDLVWYCGHIANTILEIRIANSRMFALFDEVEFVTEKFGNVELEKVVGKIEFKNVSFSYKEYEKKEEKEHSFKKPKARKIVSENKVFDKISFKIKPNTTVAFVGKSGSGKSTILNLMAKMREVDGGEILIDGVNINDLSKNTLRSTISLVNQFPYIFDMTIKENLLLAKADATDEDIKEALKKSALLEFVETLPKGIDSVVGESGIKLSGGQKQRLAIARAILRNSKIIIFDESTSSLDNFAQGEIKQSIDKLKGESTVVIVAHRLSTIKDVDKIFFLDNGEIIDTGTFEELFERNEKFKNMFLAENI